MSGTLVFRTLRSIGDLIDADELYRHHGGDHLPLPDPDDLYDAMTEGRLVGCWASTTLVAVAGVFPLARTGDPARPVAVYELAGTVVAPDWRGTRPTRLQPILTAIRAISLALEQYSRLCLVSSVAAANSRSLRGMEDAGLTVLADPPIWLCDMRRTWLAGERPDVVDHVLEGAGVAPMIDRLRETCATTMRQARSDDPWTISLQLPALSGLATMAALKPLWEEEPPMQRLLGKEPPFVRWPR